MDFGLERSIIELRPEMSITAAANYFGLDWRTVKEVEKRHLEIKYKRVRLADVVIIGVDEIFIGKMKYKTVENLRPAEHKNSEGIIAFFRFCRRGENSRYDPI